MNDTITDIRNMATKLLNEHWVCRNCGNVTLGRPERPVAIEELRQHPNALLYQPIRCKCGAVNWEVSYDPLDPAERKIL